MTIGERISQIRKELGLSQEAFGEALGVSRQAISKWESNQSMPEVDKLLAMHRLYGVSVGWLLGTEEERNEAGAMSDEQFEKIDEIVRKYMESVPKPEPKTNVRLWKLTALVMCIAFLINSVNMYQRFNRLDDRQQNLEYSIDRIQSSVDSEVQSIGNRVEEIIQKQNSLLAFYSSECSSFDLASNTVTLFFEATPKSYMHGMKVEFLVEDGFNSFRVSGVEGENRSFYASAECTLSDKIDVSVILHSNGTEQIQLIKSWDHMFSETKLPVETGHWEVQLWADSLERYEDYTTIPMDTFIWPDMEQRSLSDGSLVNVEAKTVEHLIYVNRELVQNVSTNRGVSAFTINDMTSVEYVETHDIDAFCGYMNVEFIPKLNIGDEVVIFTIVTDSYDRRYIVNTAAYVIGDDKRFDFASFDMGEIIIEDILDGMGQY